jgi:type I restriction enzyme M protein
MGASVEAYVLFVKVGSDKYVGKWHALIELPEGDCFEDMVRLRGDKEIGEKIRSSVVWPRRTT